MGGVLWVLVVLAVAAVFGCRWASRHNPSEHDFRRWLEFNQRGITPTMQVARGNNSRRKPRSLLGRAAQVAREGLDWVESGVNELMTGGSDGERECWVWKRRDFAIFSLVAMSRNGQCRWNGSDDSTAYVLGFNQCYRFIRLTRIIQRRNVRAESDTCTWADFADTLNNAWMTCIEFALECLAFAPELETYKVVTQVSYGTTAPVHSQSPATPTHASIRASLDMIPRLTAKQDYSAALQRVDELLATAKGGDGALWKSFELPIRTAKVDCFCRMIQAMPPPRRLPSGALQAFEELSSSQLTHGQFLECAATHSQYSRMLVLCDDMKGAAQAEERAAMVIVNCVSSANTSRARMLVQYSKHSAQLFVQGGELREASRLFLLAHATDQHYGHPDSPGRWAVLCMLGTGDIVGARQLADRIASEMDASCEPRGRSAEWSQLQGVLGTAEGADPHAVQESLWNFLGGRHTGLAPLKVKVVESAIRAVSELR